jgi:hypothetical protein
MKQSVERQGHPEEQGLKTKVLVFVVTSSLFFGLEARAQAGPRKFELGGQLVGLSAHSTIFPKSSAAGLTNDIDDLVLGGGLRAGYRIAEHIVVEAEVNVFQRPPTDDPATLGKWSQGFFGLKVGKQLGDIGVFGKVRPGFARFDGITSAVTLPDGSAEIRLIKDNTFFAVDIGGGIELYPSRRTIVRLDCGDAIIRYTGRLGEGFDPISNRAPRTYYGHNFQFSVGFAVRF